MMEFLLADKSNEDLKRYATELGLNVSAKLSKEKLIDALEKALIKKHKKLEAEALAELRTEAAERLGLKAGAKPSRETIAIEKSPRVFVEFLNLENPAQDGEVGADIAFDKGEKYHFHLFDGFTHVLPECVVSDKPEDAWISLAQRCVIPIYGNKTLRTGHVVSVKVGTQPRFKFIVKGPAPKDAPYGVYLEEESEVKV